ncbi:MAG: GDYXXLXY domain-containing protein [Haliangiales bacterium]
MSTELARSTPDVPATPAALRARATADGLSSDQLTRAFVRAGLRPDRARWWAFAYHQLLWIGAALAVAGVIFFVAANWGQLAPMVRIGLVAGAMSAALVAAGGLGLQAVAGRVCVVLAGLLFGPVIALYGQTYQTGADAWELFALWTVVLTAHALVARSSVTWILWLLMGHAAGLIYCDQMLASRWPDGGHALAYAIAAVIDAGLVAAAAHLLSAREGREPARVAATLGVAALTIIGVDVVVEMEIAAGQWLGMCLLPAAWLLLASRYRRRHPDLYMLFVLAMSALIIASVAIGYLFFEILDTEEFGLWLMGAVICAEVWALTRWLLRWRHIHLDLVRHVDNGAASGAASDTAGDTGSDTGDTAPAVAANRARPLDDDTPWYVRAFIGAGTWFGAFLAGIFLVIVEVHEVPIASIPLALAMLAGAAFLAARDHRPLVLDQLVWVLTVGAQLLLLASVAEISAGEHTLAVAAFIIAVGCALAIFNQGLRTLCIAAAIAALSAVAAVFELPYGQEVIIVMTTAGLVAVWLSESELAVAPAFIRRLWVPLAYGLVAGLLVPHGVLIAEREAQHAGDHSAPLSAPWAVSLMLALIGMWLLRCAAREAHAIDPDGPRVAPATHAAAAFGVAAIALATHSVPGVTTALLVLVLAHLRGRRGLQMVAYLYLAGALSVFYYQLSTTLLVKSLAVLGAGILLLAGAALMRSREGKRVARARVVDKAARRRDMRRVALLLALSLLIPGGLSAHKERILGQGEIIHLQLRPRDPRSLMQGDYMVLRYAMSDAVLAAQPARGRGILIVTVDERGVAEFARLDDGRGPTAERERRLRFAYVPGDSPEVRIGAESFFFEEGTGDIYAQARYGRLMVDGDGRSVLVGLADDSLTALTGPQSNLSDVQ